MNQEAQRASALHQHHIIIQALDFTPEAKFTPAIYPVLQASGVTALHLTVAQPYYTWRQTLASIAHYTTVITRLGPTRIQIARTADAIREAKQCHRVAVIGGLQNLAPIGENLQRLTQLSQLGIRILQLTYQSQNRIGAGCNVKHDQGLTRFGEQVVAEMNRLGLLIDLSHVGPLTSMETIERSKAPCAFTHTCAHALFAHVRNKTDEQLHALAEKGGVIGVAAYSPFYHRQRRPTLDDYLKQIEYIVDLVGVNHVGIGLDLVFDRDPVYHAQVKQRYPEVVTSFHWDTIYPVGLESITQLPNITRGLVQHGYSDQEIVKILGANLLRLFEQVWTRLPADSFSRSASAPAPFRIVRSY
jgi:membrane dipeptidase